ncbi:MAG TPA: hypothetical protein VFE36_06230 [Candidatus Baltobacteraceae bacterium]|jgi:hypothetical protein|nr:hypothetical protein [Candidatus Baltobacteraceae bacterium]
MKSTRGEFLAAGIALTATPQIAAAASPTPRPEPAFPPLHFDVAAFDAVLNVPATHKHLFAAAKINDGLILDAARNTLTAYSDIGISPKDVQPALVFYHFTSCLGFDDFVWNNYFIPARPKTRPIDEFATDVATIANDKTRGNPCLHKTGKPGDTSIESLIADANARFFVCNNATRYLASYVAKQLKLDQLDVYGKMTAHLIPNAMLVPAGVWGIHAVQERHYTYLQATL